MVVEAHKGYFKREYVTNGRCKVKNINKKGGFGLIKCLIEIVFHKIVKNIKYKKCRGRFYICPRKGAFYYGL